MWTSQKEGLSWAIETSREVAREVAWETEQSLSILEKETWVNFFKRAWDWIKNLFESKWNEAQDTSSATTSMNETTEVVQSWWDKISDEMFQQLLKMEWSQKYVAKTATYFGEKFTTWPYGMVYKHIDENWNLLKRPKAFKEWEHVSPTWAKNNARAHYDKCAKERKDSLREKWLQYNQNELDSLVSASGWTIASKKRLQKYVFSHWNNKDAISKYMSNFAVTAAWNWKVMPGLVRRRKFESNWFKWNKQPFETYRA